MPPKPNRRAARKNVTSGATTNHLVSQPKNQSKQRKRTTARMANSPRKQLKALRQRAGLSNAACAEALGLAGATSYQRYESAAKYDTDRYRYGFVQKLMPIFVGRGSPPITEDEMLAISELTNVSQTPAPTYQPEDLAGQRSPTYQQTPQASQAPINQPIQFAAVSPTGAPGPTIRVRQRYAIEPGTFYHRDRIFGQNISEVGPFTPMFYARSFPPESQFGVFVYPGVLEEFGPHGAHILCVNTDDGATLLSKPGNTVVAAVAVQGNSDLFSIRLLVATGAGSYRDESGAMVTSDVTPLGVCMTKWQIMLVNEL